MNNKKLTLRVSVIILRIIKWLFSIMCSLATVERRLATRHIYGGIMCMQGDRKQYTEACHQNLVASKLKHYERVSTRDTKNSADGA